MKTAAKPAPAPAAPSAPLSTFRMDEITSLACELRVAMQDSCRIALLMGLRLAALHRETNGSNAPGGFKAALDKLEFIQVPRSTAYRWLNAAVCVLARAEGIEDQPERLAIPLWDPADAGWREAEATLTAAANGMSIRRLMLGSAATGDESRMDTLLTAAESGDRAADEMLEKVSAGQLTLVQAIRAAAGQKATKEKSRHDPVYLDIDGRTGQPVGLFPKCLVTLGNTFARWDSLDESARVAARQSWKALVSQLPKDLR